MTGERGSQMEEAEQLLHGQRTISVGRRRLHFIGKVVLATGMVASLVGIAALWGYTLPQSTHADLMIPFKLYEGRNHSDLLKMPQRADQYDGVEDKRPIEVVADAQGNSHVYVIGDWGATLPNHQTFANPSYHGGDVYAQMVIADKVKRRAELYDPQYVLNVGDNFYIDGLHISCQSPPDAIRGNGEGAFSSGWQGVYADVANKPWISTLGNHDYGGYNFGNGWPQQIGYSFINYNWIMPARYYNKKVQHPGFTAEYFVYDSNAFDAKPSGEDQNHNICSWHNQGGPGSCGNNGGMPSIQGCYQWFWDTHRAQRAWLDKKLGESTADWKIVVTHFPCGYDTDFWKEMKAQHGVDLLVTGHRHQQEMWRLDTDNDWIRSAMIVNEWDGKAPACIVSGGGGGITAEGYGGSSHGKDMVWYGFYHLTMNKEWMNIELVTDQGNVYGNWTIYPHGTEGYEQQKNVTFDLSRQTCGAFCNGQGNAWLGGMAQGDLRG